MKKSIMALSATLYWNCSFCTKVAFEEYNLDNGLHVILQNDPSAPVVITSVMYHVGSKNENPERTGFAHFSNICYLKVQKISSVENGLKL
jgi:predicted Zn-dependent peptidase